MGEVISKFERKLAQGIVLNKMDDEYRADVARLNQDLIEAERRMNRLAAKLLDAQYRIIMLKKERNDHWRKTYPALKKKWIEFGRRHP